MMRTNQLLTERSPQAWPAFFTQTVQRMGLRSLLAALALALVLVLNAAPPAHAFPPADPTACAVVGWGLDYYGGATAPAGLSDVLAIAAGSYHSLALKSDGTVVGWGYNDYGQATVPAGLSDVLAIAAGNYHSLALKSDGTVVGWGYNYEGQINIPAGLSDVVAINAGDKYSLALKSDGTVVGWGDNVYGQATPPAGLNDVVAIAAGNLHSLALKSDGTVVNWGSNNGNLLTPPAGLSDVVAIAAGSSHSLALKADGTVVGWGDNGSGRATPPAGLSDVVAIAGGSYHSLALKSDGTVVGWGYNYYGQATPPAGLSGVIAIAAGYEHSLAAIADCAPANNPPTVAADNASVTVDEGQTATNSGTVSDPDGDTVTLSASVGTVVNNNDGTWSWSFATSSTADSQTVTITADDGNGGIAQTSFDLTVNAVAIVNARINGTDCNLIDAVTAANTDTATGACAAGMPGADTIELLDNVTLVSLSGFSGLPQITSEITIHGSGFTIARDAGAPNFVMIALATSGSLTLNDMTITGGRSTGGGGFFNRGILTLNNSTVSGNSVDSTTGTPRGGGIINLGTVTLNNSTISNNTALEGGAIHNSGTVTLNNSTVSANTSDVSAAIHANLGTVTLNKSIVADQAVGADCVGTITSAGYNLDSDGTCSLSATGDISNGTANLGPLQVNAPGNTATHALLAGSPAIDAAPSGLATDQRGVTRPQGAAFDIGAFELEQSTSNTAPVAVDDSYTTNQDTPLIVPSPTVLDNDTDADGDTLTAILVDPPAHGTLTLNANGSFDYTPNAGYTGTDSFTYKASDGTADSNVATVTITIIDTNDAPVAVDDSYSTDEDTPLTVAAPGLLGNDTDAEGDPLNAIEVNQPAKGSLTLNPDGSFSYTPDADFCGVDSFSYKANDSQADSNVATVNVTVNCVNDAPTATADSYSTNEDTPLTIAAPGVLENDSDVEGNALSATLVTGPSNGAVTLNADGSFTYTPNANFNAPSGHPDSFTYKANDGAADSTVATVSITVDAVNDAPTAADDGYSTDEDTPLTIAAPGVLGNDSDLDGDGLTAAVVDAPANGTLTLNADGSFTYTPDADFNGPDSFTYQANDGTANSNVATVSITVNAVNDAPLASDDSYSTDEDIPLTVSAPGVLDNDTDGDGDSLTAVLVSGPSNGTVTLNADGSFTYTPAANFDGNDSFSYKANDGTSDSNVTTVTIVVGGVNDAPVAADDSYSTDEDTPLTVPAPGVLGNDSDEESDPLTATLVDAPANGTVTLNPDGSFTYTPDANFNGSDSFTYQASDGGSPLGLDSNIATVSITVNALDDAPVAMDDDYSTNEDTPLTVPAPGVLDNDSDAEGSALTASLVSGPSNGSLTLNADGSFSYTPNANFNGADSFTYKANDGASDSNVATVSLTVNAVNDAPVAADDGYTTDENVALTVPAPGVLGNDSDVEASPLSAVLVSAPANGTVTLNADGSLTYTPTPYTSGTDSFSYKANDGAADSSVATVTITVVQVNIPVETCGDYTVLKTPSGSYIAPGWSGNVIVGNNGWNFIIGSNSADLILGRGGPDDIFGLKGNDLICGGDGIDIIAGGDGNDKLYGGDNPDWLIGGDGNDTLYGGEGNDTLRGDDDQDALYGEDGFDVLRGGSHNDYLDGGAGPDALDGDSGVDTLTGGPGNDLLLGGNDSDNLAGNDGNDALYGNNGNDALDGGAEDDFCWGGSGSDTIANCEGLSAASGDEVDINKDEAIRRWQINGDNANEQQSNRVFLPQITR